MNERQDEPTLGEMIEATLTAVPYPGVFVKLAPRPAPSYVVMAANLTCFWAAGLAIRVVRELVAGSQGFELTMTVLPAAMAVVAVICFSVPGAAVLHVVAKIAGGAADFKRSYQIVSMISSVAVIDALLSFAPGLWWVRALLAAWLMAEGVQAFHGAPTPRARSVFAAMGLLAVGLQLQARQAADRLIERQAVAELQQAMGMPRLPSQPGRSGLDLLRPADDAAAPIDLDELPGEQAERRPFPPPSFNPAEPPAQTGMPQGPELRAMAGMFDSLIPMLKNARNHKGVKAEQRQQIDSLISLIERQKQVVFEGKEMTPEEEKKQMEIMMKLQGQMMQLMAKPPATPQSSRPEPTR